MGLRIDMLGPVEAWTGGRTAALGGELARSPLALLALTAGRVVSSELELDRHDQLLGRLESLVTAHPFQERLVGLQMLALYRGGRQADALAAFRAARARFADGLGIEPGEALRELHQDVLRHAGSLTP